MELSLLSAADIMDCLLFITNITGKVYMLSRNVISLKYVKNVAPT